jgi:hypothetical protein
VQLPAVNTPQFNWALNKTGSCARPVPPVFEPEVPARAIVFAAFHPRREIWVGFPTVKAILANRIAPGLADRYLAAYGYSSQMTPQPTEPDQPNNLYEPVKGDYGPRGRFGAEARDGSYEMFTDRHKMLAYATLAVSTAAGLVGLHLLAKKYDF